MGKREGSFRQKKEEWSLGKPTTSVMLQSRTVERRGPKAECGEVYVVMISKADACAVHKFLQGPRTLPMQEMLKESKGPLFIQLPLMLSLPKGN